MLKRLDSELRPRLEPRLLKSIDKPLRVSFAFRTKGDALAECEGKVFARLPIYPTGLRFHVEARFPTTMGRDGIQMEDPLTHWLVDILARVAETVPAILQRSGWLGPKSFGVVPLPRDTEPPFDAVANAIRRSLTEGSFLPAEDGTRKPPKDLLLAHHQTLYQLLGSQDLREVTGNEGAVWIDTELRRGRAADVAESLGVTRVAASDFLDWLTAKVSDPQALVPRGNPWFLTLYELLAHMWHQMPDLRFRIRGLPIVRLRSGELARPSAAVLPIAETELEPELQPYLDELPIVDDAIAAADRESAGFLRTVDVRDFDLVRLVDLFLQREYLQGKPSLGRNRRHIRLLFQLWQAKRIAPHEWKRWRDLPILQNQFRKLVPPSKAYLPERYGGLRAARTFLQLAGGCSFVVSSYPEDTSRPRFHEWGEFLRDLGVARLPRLDEGWWVETSWWGSAPALEAEARGYREGYQNSTRGYALFEWQVFGLATVLQHLEAGAAADKASAVWETMVQVTRQPAREIPCKFCDLTHRVPVTESRLFWFYYSCYSRGLASSALKRLKELPWLPDAEGRPRLPGDLFDPSLRQALGPDLSYLNDAIPLKDDASRSFAGLLGVQLEAAVPSLLGHLRSLQQRKAGDAERVRPVYEQLAKQIKDENEEWNSIVEAFRDEQLILVPRWGWYRPESVCWTDRRGALPSLSESWGGSELKKFFTALRVPESATPDQYANLLLEAAGGEPWDEKRLTPVYKAIEEAHQSGDLSRELWGRLRAERCWLGRRGGTPMWAEAPGLVWNDEPHLAELFRDRIAFWAIGDSRALARDLGVAPMSAAKPSSSALGDLDSDESTSTRLSQIWRYIQRFAGSSSDDLPDLSSLPCPPAYRLMDLTVRYEINGVVSEPDPEATALYDTDFNRVVVDGELRERDVPDAIGDALERIVSLHDLREFIKDLWFVEESQSVVDQLRKWGKRRGVSLMDSETQPAERETETEAKEPESASDGGGGSPAKQPQGGGGPGGRDTPTRPVKKELDLPPLGDLEIEVAEYIPGSGEPRRRVIRPSGAGQDGGTDGGRRDPDIVGHRAEEIVRIAEMDRLRESGLDWSECLTWISQNTPTADHDFESVDDAGETVYIEVKAASSSGTFRWTRNEMNLARGKRQQYWLYLVFGATTVRPKPVLYRDPVGLWERGELELDFEVMIGRAPLCPET
jgi:hypothetical protein